MPRALTTTNVDPADPFGELTIDTAVRDIPAYLSTLTPEARLEVEQRCSVINSNHTLYDATVVAFCAAVMEAVEATGEPAAPAAPAPAP